MTSQQCASLKIDISQLRAWGGQYESGVAKNLLGPAFRRRWGRGKARRLSGFAQQPRSGLTLTETRRAQR